jgi:hypothetical protein
MHPFNILAATCRTLARWIEPKPLSKRTGTGARRIFPRTWPAYADRSMPRSPTLLERHCQIPCWPTPCAGGLRSRWEAILAIYGMETSVLARAASDSLTVSSNMPGEAAVILRCHRAKRQNRARRASRRLTVSYSDRNVAPSRRAFFSATSGRQMQGSE